MTMRSTKTLLAAALAVCTHNALAVDIDVQAIALTGEAAQGAGGAVFDSFYFIGPAINASGEVHFSATLSGAGVTSANDSGAWLGDAGGLTKLARTGDTAPGTTGIYKEIVFAGPINASGQTLIRAQLLAADADGDGIEDEGIWRGSSAGTQLVVREGDSASGAFGTFHFNNVGSGVASLSDTGEAIFNAIYDMHVQGGSTTPIGAIWRGSPGSLSPVAIKGDQVSGQPAGVTFSVFDSPVVNRLGEVAFGGFVSGATGNSDGYFTQSGATLGRSVTGDDVAPGTGGQTFNGFNDIPGWNDAGQIAFSASLSGGSFGVFKGTPGALSMVALSGDAATGTEAGVTFKGFARVPISSSGAVGFLGVLQGTGIVQNVNDRGVWTDIDGTLELMMRLGDQAPGVEAGVIFDNAVTPQIAGDMLVIGAFLSGPGTHSENNKGFWAYRNGQLELILREGDEIEVAPGVFKTIAQLGSLHSGGLGTESGSAFSLNEAGDVAFQAELTDGTEGIFVLTVVPEPSSAVLLFGVAPLLVRRGRQREFDHAQQP